jgi:hypothetical protein
MKKIIIAVILLVLILIVILIRNEKPVEFNEVELYEGNLISNRTYISYYDTIANLGLKELDITGVTVLFRPIEDTRLIEGLELLAYIIGNECQYVIYIGDLHRTKAIEVITHELIHLEQIKDKRLVKFSGYSVWDGKQYSNDIPYNQRPWEIDAFSRGRTLENTITNILVK